MGIVDLVEPTEMILEVTGQVYMDSELACAIQVEDLG